jgi:hypothetical protein
MLLLGNPLVVSVEKPASIVLTGGCITRDFQTDPVSYRQAAARLELGPVNSSQGEVLSACARPDRMTLGLQRLDHLQGKETDGPVRPPVERAILLAVTFDT